MQEHDHEHEESHGVHFQHLEPEELEKIKQDSFGPVAWCNRCSRRHRRRDCQLVYVPVELKPGLRPAKNSRRVVKYQTAIRLVHNKVEE